MWSPSPPTWRDPDFWVGFLGIVVGWGALILVIVLSIKLGFIFWERL